MRAFRRTLMIVVPVLLSAMLMAPAPAGAGAKVPPLASGYWLAGADGGVFAFGAPFFGSGVGSGTAPGACTFSPQAPSPVNSALGCSTIAATPSGDGYWLLNAYRWVNPYGKAGNPEQSSCTSLNGATGRWVGMTSSTSGAGFWLVSSNGGVVGCGDAQAPYGGLTSTALTAPVVGMAGTPDGKGYWLVAADGGVFSFGEAGFYGSMGGTALKEPVVGMAATPDGKGYWLVAADGGVFTFGDASFFGSMGGQRLDAPVVGMARAPDGKGYWLAAADGGVFSFGSAPFEGSMAGSSLTGPIVGIATDRSAAPR